MSRDSMELEEVEEQEVDLVSMLAGQGEPDESEEEDEAGEIPSDPEELKAYAESLRERVAKRNKSLRKAKEAQHRTQQERDAIAAKIDALEARLNSSQQSTQGTADLERQAQEWAEKVELDPTKAIEYADWKQQQLESKLANYLEDKFNKLEERFAGIQTATNPEMIQHKAEIDMLKSNPDFAGLDDNTLLNLAKGLRRAAPKKPRGGIGGQRAKADESGRKLSKEDEAAIRAAVRNF